MEEVGEREGFGGATVSLTRTLMGTALPATRTVIHLAGMLGMVMISPSVPARLGLLLATIRTIFPITNCERGGWHGRGLVGSGGERVGGTRRSSSGVFWFI